ncbi:GspE/PulE family protein [Synechococcus sp. CS-1327]|uniref:GspE/PulE family protein n=1 Tax=Synechococcus sp. CS-1327 TaxID=2847977 RepID=UPI00223C3C93|nr:GspE/PulE family protein [Synechococcus sp. CS-1327]MCT0233991.1 GspE/PulE family protein [Synechococcus sp. CS-1327]
MTRSVSRPVPEFPQSDQQRIERELLLGERMLRAGELQQADPQAMRACASIDAAGWQAFGCLPLRRIGERLVVAVPADWGPEQREAITSAVARSGLQTDLRLGLKQEIEAVLADRLLGGSPPPDADSAATRPETQIPAGALPPPPARISLLEDLSLDEQLAEEEQEQDGALNLESSLSASNASPVVSLVNRILIQALDTDSSDIHVEPQEDGLQIRFRQDGVLHPLEQLPKSLIPAITSRLKIMADLDIAERRMPQDGRIRRVFKGRSIELRVSTLPGRWGEKVVMRLLDSSSAQLSLGSLITDAAALAKVRALGSKPFGMVLVTGPTGSGKSTTLYALLSERNDPGINISTVEDPIEYSLKGITQTQVNRDKGYNFSTALRAFMRQDPDVLLVGETRDGETAKTAIEAALTGHLVLTTLHCNDAPSAIARLQEMGVEPFMVSASLLGIVSQRLLRRLRMQCRISYHPSEEELGHFGLLASQEERISFYRANHSHDGNQPSCPTCQGRGYKGRIGVYEVLRVNDTLATAISQGASTDVIRKISLDAGMKTLLGYGLDLVREGYTTLEEVERMLLTDTELESERRIRALTTLTCQGCGAGLKSEWLECPYCLTPRE